MTPLLARSSLLPLLLLAGSAVAQEEAPPQPGDGPVVVGTPRDTWKSVEVIKLEAALEFRLQYQRDQIRQTGQADQRTTQSRHRELFDLSTEMAFGHRNLALLTGAVQFGLEDISTKTNVQDDDHESDFVSMWDLNALFFATSAAPTDVFARREQSTLDRAFAGNIEQTLTEEGIGTRISGENSNASFRYFHRETELSGGFGDIDSNVTQDSFVAQGNALLTDTQRLEAVYTFDLIDESQTGGFADSYARQDANVVHTLVFGPEELRHELRSSLRYYSQSGLQDLSNLRLDEVLTLRHSRRLESRYNLSVDTRDVRGRSQDQVRGEASIRHRLFESLTSTATVGLERQSSSDGFSSDEAFISGQLDYTKAVPYGRLDIGGGASFNRQSNGERGSNASIIDEAYVFNDGFAIIIVRRNIIPGSFVITPTQGFPRFQEGLDYTVSVFPDHAEVRGVLGGAFVDGQTLLISYDVGPEPGNDIDTTGTTLSIRYSITEGWLDGLALYTTYRTTAFSVQADDPSLFAFDDVQDLLVGTEYTIGGLDLTLEYNDHDSTFDAYSLHRIQAIYILTLGPGSNLSADASREVIDFRSQNNQVTFDRAGLRWNYRLNDSLDFTARLEYRNEDSQQRGDSIALDESVGLSWTRRQTTMYCNVRNSDVDSNDSNQTSQFLECGIRRQF
ncbi:MAG: hypothetical protein ACOYN0_04720 [Phycisphaerales bacterium]